MVDGFKIEVPITLKGGREGEKVGKQIGEKIAAQLKKAFQAINIGGAGTGGSGVVGAAGMVGVSKGLKGVAMKLGVIGAAIGAAVGLLAKSSPYLKGILDIFGRAFMIFFRPFGDFLATLLRPLAILLMKMAIAFLKWTRPLTGKVREAVETVPQIGETGSILADIPIGIANWALKLGAALGAIILEIGKAAFNLGSQIGQWLLDHVILPAGNFLSEKLLAIWDWTNDFAGWLWEQVTSIWSWTFDFAEWLWAKVTSIWNWTFDFAGWLWNQVKSALSLGGIGGGGKSGGSLFGVLKSLLGFKDGGIVPGPLGQPRLAIVHGGESITPANKKSINFRPTFNITGNMANDIDVDSIVRRAGRMTELDLKQRGII